MPSYQLGYTNRPRHAVCDHANRNPTGHNGCMQLYTFQACLQGKEKNHSRTQSKAREFLHFCYHINQLCFLRLQFAHHCLLRLLLLFEILEYQNIACWKFPIQPFLHCSLSLQLLVHPVSVLDRFGAQSGFPQRDIHLC